MKIAYTAPFSDGTGYSHAAIAAFEALHTTGVDIVALDVKLNTNKHELPDSLNKALLNSKDGVTHVVHHTVPEYFYWKNGVTNIGFFYCETSNFIASNWQFHCNLMERVVVSSEHNRLACLASDVEESKMRILPYSCEPSQYEQKTESLNLPLTNKYVFYTIGDFSVRKNIIDIIKAYYVAFTKKDNVVLVLKTFIGGKSPQEAVTLIGDAINKLRQNMRLHLTDNYPEIMIVPEVIDDKQIAALHSAGDCYISIERGNGWCIPLFDACCFGKTIITTDKGSHIDYINQYDGNKHIIASYNDLVLGMDDHPFVNLYTSRETWYRPDVLELIKSMKMAYGIGTQSKVPNLSFASLYSHSKVGPLWQNILE